MVCPDLRGYGRSSKPKTDPDHEPYSKRAMGADQILRIDSAPLVTATGFPCLVDGLRVHAQMACQFLGGLWASSGSARRISRLRHCH